MTLTIRATVGIETTAVKQAALALLRPPPKLTVSQWAAKYRVLSRKDSPQPGRWKSEPHQIAIMDAFSDPKVRVVVVKAASQTVGKSQMMNNVIGFFIDQEPSNMVVMHPTLAAAEKWSKGRLDPLIEVTPKLHEKIPNRKSRDADSTILHRQFTGGQMFIVGSNAPADLAAQSVRIVLADEVDRYEASAGQEGDPLELAEQRTERYWNAKIGHFSTPLIDKTSRIDASYAESDRNIWQIRCPHCAGHFAPLWRHVEWDRGAAGEHLPDTAHMLCPLCGTFWTESDRLKAILAGQWEAQAPFIGTRGFWINALGCRSANLPKLVRRFLRTHGSPEREKTFKNLVMAETWAEPGDSPEWQRLYDRRERFKLGTVPMGGLVLTAGSDLQKDRIEVYVWAWGRGMQRWLVDRIIIEGGPEKAQTWQKLREILEERWPHESGQTLGLSKLAIDTGYEANAVYTFARAVGDYQLLMPIKGSDGFDQATPVKSPTYVETARNGKKLRRGAKLWSVATATFKSELYRFFRLEKPTDEIAAAEGWPAGYVHLPEVDSEVVQQLVAERRALRNGRYHWEKLRERNEGLDCAVYARAAAWLLGLDRWTDHKWRDLEAALGISESLPHAPASAQTASSPAPPVNPAIAPPRPAARQRQVFRSSRHF